MTRDEMAERFRAWARMSTAGTIGAEPEPITAGKVGAAVRRLLASHTSPVPTGWTAGILRSRGYLVPIDVPDEAELWADQMEAVEFTADPTNPTRVNFSIRVVGGVFRWESGEFGFSIRWE